MNILALVVLYNQKATESKTLEALFNNYVYKPLLFNNFRLIIYDNGPTDQKNEISLPFNYLYIFSAGNEGLAKAYNYALKKSVQDNYDWLLLLDQDSLLPDHFIEGLFIIINSTEDRSMITAIVPKMSYKNDFFSPSRVFFGGIHRSVDMKKNGILPFEVCAIGSGSMLKVSFFNEIGGFNEFFWLDCLDRWIYFVIHKEGGKVYITDTVIEHELSVMDYSSFISEKRYANIMKYETYFMRFYKSGVENIVYCFRLMKRSIFLLLKRKTQKFGIMTLVHLKEVVFNPQKFRLQDSNNPN